MAWEDLSPKERREKLAKLAQLSALEKAPKFEVKRIYMDVARSRYDQLQPINHVIGSVIKSFWICDWSGDFDARIVPNHISDRKEGSGLPLRKNMCMPFAVPAADACLEFDAQPGVWVDVAYSDSEDIQIGSIEASLSATSTEREGNTFTQSKITLGATSPFAVVFSANGSRGASKFRNRTLNPIYVGTDAQLNAAGYEEECFVVLPNEIFEWKNAAELRARVDSGSATVVALEQLV